MCFTANFHLHLFACTQICELGDVLVICVDGKDPLVRERCIEIVPGNHSLPYSKGPLHLDFLSDINESLSRHPVNVKDLIKSLTFATLINETVNTGTLPEEALSSWSGGGTNKGPSQGQMGSIARRTGTGPAEARTSHSLSDRGSRSSQGGLQSLHRRQRGCPAHGAGPWRQVEMDVERHSLAELCDDKALLSTYGRHLGRVPG